MKSSEEAEGGWYQAAKALSICFLGNLNTLPSLCYLHKQNEDSYIIIIIYLLLFPFIVTITSKKLFLLLENDLQCGSAIGWVDIFHSAFLFLLLCSWR